MQSYGPEAGGTEAAPPILLSPFEAQVFYLALRYQQIWNDRTHKRNARWIPTGRDPRGSKHWQKFIQAEKLRARLAADPWDFICSQFDSLAGFLKCPYPYPNMLYTPNAERRYREWMERRAVDRVATGRLTETKEDRNALLIACGTGYVEEFMMRFPDKYPHEAAVFKDRGCVSVLPEEYLRQNKLFCTLVNNGWYRVNWGEDPGFVKRGYL